MTESTLRFGILLTAFLIAPCAWAHSGAQGADFVTGLTHPLVGLDHLLAMLAVGFWGASQGRTAVWTIPAAFLGAMAMGGLWGTAGPTLPLMEPGIALSVTGLGALIYERRRWPLGTASGLLVVFGTLHGYAHGQEAANSTDFAAYAAGFVTATGLLLRTGIALGQRLDGIPRLYRACGAVMGLVGTSLLALGF